MNPVCILRDTMVTQWAFTIMQIYFAQLVFEMDINVYF